MFLIINEVTYMKKLLCLILSCIILLSFAGCSKSPVNEESKTDTSETTIMPETTTTPEITTQETTIPETTTAEQTTIPAPDFSINKKIADELKAGVFYMAGSINPDSDMPITVNVTCDGKNIRATIVSDKATMTVVQLDDISYLIDNKSNKYAEINEDTVKDLDALLSSLSVYGINLNGTEKTDIKNMISDIDTSFDYSQYLENAIYEEFVAKQDEKEYLCSSYKTEDGACHLYTCDGELTTIDVYDAEGLRQINLQVDAYIPETLVPITLTGFTKTGSVLDLFVQGY